MPHLNVSSPTGDVNFYYNIATPTLPSSATIVADLPSILFIHGEYFGQHIFEPQFSDPQLRKRFNLIGIDIRGFGGTGGDVPETYTPTNAAHDKNLEISSIHIYAVSIGTHVALELAISHPDVVQSLTLCSTLPSEEPEEVGAGRLEVFEYWRDSSIRQSTDAAPKYDEELVAILTTGSLQVSVGEHSTKLTEAMTRVTLGRNLREWQGSPEALLTSRILSADWFFHRRVFDVESLAKIRCPITIIHCEDDIAYPLRHAQEFESLLREAGHTQLTLCQVPGPRFVNMVYPQVVNPILLDRVLSVTESNRPPGVVSSKIENLELLTTPFTDILAQHGYPSDWDEDFE